MSDPKVAWALGVTRGEKRCNNEKCKSTDLREFTRESDPKQASSSAMLKALQPIDKLLDEIKDIAVPEYAIL